METDTIRAVMDEIQKQRMNEPQGTYIVLDDISDFY
jgi:hypothetical protein